MLTRFFKFIGYQKIYDEFFIFFLFVFEISKHLHMFMWSGKDIRMHYLNYNMKMKLVMLPNLFLNLQPGYSPVTFDRMANTCDNMFSDHLSAGFHICVEIKHSSHRVIWPAEHKRWRMQILSRRLGCLRTDRDHWTHLCHWCNSTLGIPSWHLQQILFWKNLNRCQTWGITLYDILQNDCGYMKAAGDTFRCCIAYAPLSASFKHNVFKKHRPCMGSDTFWNAVWFQQNPNNQPWFTFECDVAISYHNHYYNIC